MSIEMNRQRIDDIDEQIILLLQRRAKIAREISLAKLNAGLQILDRGREATVFSRVRRLAAGHISSDVIDQIYEAIMSESRRVQAAVRNEIVGKGIV